MWEATSTRADPGKHSMMGSDVGKTELGGGGGGGSVESVDAMGDEIGAHVIIDEIGDQVMIDEMGAHVMSDGIGVMFDMLGVGVVGSSQVHEHTGVASVGSGVQLAEASLDGCMVGVTLGLI